MADAGEETLSDDLIAADAILSVQIALDQMERFKNVFVSLFFWFILLLFLISFSFTMTANFEPLAFFLGVFFSSSLSSIAELSFFYKICSFPFKLITC